MFFPRSVLLEATRQALQSAEALSDGVASTRESILMALDLMLAVEDPASGHAASWVGRMPAVLASHAADPQPTDESAEDTLKRLEHLIFERPAVDAAQRGHKELCLALCDWESGLLSGVIGHADNTQPGAADVLSGDRWEAYLRERFADPQLRLSAFRTLPGGFGKQTFLFSVEGASLSGDFVLRRDMAEPMLRHGCHRVDREFELIRAVLRHGFPAPDALWLDTGHAGLPGGDFFVMRRSPGSPGGSVFSASGQVPDDLVETLAGVLARLHGLPRLKELRGAIDPALWERSRAQCTRQYIETWLGVLRQDVHLPSPSIAGLLGWLLANVPESDEPPVLLHGDIGFHNFLFHEGSLSTVLDWEFSHVGDPAEDLAYVRNTLGEAIDWNAFMSAYVAHGGRPVDRERLRYFQVWGHVRNACSASIAAAKLAEGRVKDLKLVLLPFAYVPHFLRAAARALAQEDPHDGQ